MIDVSDLLGKPFAWGGRGPDAYDCWGLVVEVARRAGITLPDMNHPADGELCGQIWKELCGQRMGKDFIRIERPEPWCLVAFQFFGQWHAGIVLENASQFIHVVERQNVTAPSLYCEMWQPFFRGFYRYVGQGCRHICS